LSPQGFPSSKPIGLIGREPALFVRGGAQGQVEGLLQQPMPRFYTVASGKHIGRVGSQHPTEAVAAQRPATAADMGLSHITPVAHSLRSKIAA
jgi:hypothetical protein